MGEYISRSELYEWIDQEGGIYEFITGHGFDSSEIDPADTELTRLWAQAEEAARALYKHEAALEELEGWGYSYYG